MGKIMIWDDIVVATDLIKELSCYLSVNAEIFKDFQVRKYVDCKVTHLSVCVEMMLEIGV